MEDLFAKKNEEIQEDKIYELVELFTIGQQILGEKVEIKKKNPYDTTNEIKVIRNDRYDYLKVRYSEIMATVEFILHRGVDDRLINKLLELAKEDETGDDRFLVEEQNGEYNITAILIGQEAFEEMFPKMYAAS